MTTLEKYKNLKSVYYENISNNSMDKYKETVNSRKNNELSIYTGLIMSPFKREFRTKEQFEIFYLPSVQIYRLQEDIDSLSKTIEKMMSQLPQVAQTQLFFNNLIDEVQSTNDIEGVRSSREEISLTIDKLMKNNKNGRFSGLVKLYLKFQENKYNTIHEVKDFRDIWNELVSDEIEKADDMPDGKLFRKEGEVINSGERIIHRGDASEDEIISHLSSLVTEMNDENIPSLPKCFVAHYYYEYIHPFYDGNGRTGRFIACSYLSRKLDMMSAINFSSAIVQNKDLYYKAFTDMSNPYNQGEATSFIISMMRLLKKGQYSIIEKLDDGIKKMMIASKLTDNDELSDLAQNVLYIFCQKEIFGNYVGAITDVDMVGITEVSRYLLNKALDELEEKGFIKLISGNPKVHGLTDDIKGKLFED
ncbi:Fic family protein [Lactiplantibacillus brownii]|uniref:Fic family protein n=1 Tax=Lactiplantibacillus brownii TaxID=3069269 RepID=UPI0038B33CF1